MWVTNKYNSFGEIIESIRNSSSETYTYDIEGRIVTHTVKDKDMGEVKTSYTYDVLGRTTSITTGAGTENITYDDAGRISVKSLPSQGTEKRYSYYKNGLLKSVITYRNGQLTNTENSEYDLSGNKTLEETDGNIKRYAYDGLNRLKSVIEHNGDQTEYEFDSFGNISKEYTLTPGDIKTKYYQYDNANRLILMYDDKTSAEYTYDAEGNMITKVSDAGGSVSASNYVYDGYNRLSEVYSQNTEAQYSYNPEGLRESKTVNGNATRFLYDNGNIIGEFTGDDYYIYHRGTELIGYTSFSGKSATYQQNSHGNVTALLDYDGTELKTYTYNAYGKEQAFTANPQGNQTILYQWKNETDNTYNPFRYCGEYVDAETGLIYLRNRYYDPSVGRFITEDPARDGENWYIYANNNPIMFVDPSGLKIVLIGSESNVQTIWQTIKEISHDDLELTRQRGREGTLVDRYTLTITSENNGHCKVGTELVRRLVSSDKWITIQIGTNGNLYIPSQKTIQFDPYSNPDIRTVDPKTGNIVSGKRPNFIGLAHEMIHAERDIRGITLSGYTDYKYQKTRTKWTWGPFSGYNRTYFTQNVPKEELATVGLKFNTYSDITENKIRQEHGLRMRGAY